MVHLFRADYYEAWQFVPFLVLASTITCLNNFLNSVYVVYKRSSSSLYTMLAGAVLNLVLNYLFILWLGPVGVTSASFLSLLLVFLLRARSTRSLLVIDFQAGRMLVQLGLILIEIAVLFYVDAWVLPTTLLTAVVCLLNAREVLSMAQKLLGMVGGRLRKKG